MLFSDSNSPFIVILAIDPHVISKVSSHTKYNLKNTPNYTINILLY